MEKKSQSKRRKLTPQQKKKKRIRQILLFLVEIIALVVLIVAFWGVSSFKKIGHVSFDDGDITINEEVEEQATTGAMKGYLNIALFGVDSTEHSLTGNTRTDTMIIASINRDTKEIKLVSLLRDTYLNLGTDTYNKANHAYAQGGAKQALSMMNMNLDLNITDFVTVGFDGLVRAIDAVGGIEIDVPDNPELLIHLNNYQMCIKGHKTGTLNAAGEPEYYAEPYVEFMPVEHTGLQTLDGAQATAYCRVRYVGNDYARTARQREVITAFLKKAVTLSPSKLNQIAEEVFPMVSTSLELGEIISLLADAPGYKMAGNTQFPIPDMFAGGNIGAKGSCLVTKSLETNVITLHEFLFDDTEYVPSETVKTCSEKIKADTAQYVGY